MALHPYLPEDRLRALALGRPLPEQADGVVLVADITGFTPLAERLVQGLGERDGVESLSRQVQAVYEALVDESLRYGGSVVGFAGDSVTCWFDAVDGPAAPRAATCALAMQRALGALAPLAIKVAAAAGPVRRLAVGDPAVQTLDLLAGPTMARALRGEALAGPGQVCIDRALAEALGLPVAGDGFLPLDPAWGPPAAPFEPRPVPEVEPDRLRPWVLPVVVEREAAGQDLFAVDLRPATALFMRLAAPPGSDAAAVTAARVGPVQQVLARHGGVLLELADDGDGACFYASFGAVRVHEDDPGRALAAALALRAQYGADAVQVGLSAGTLRVGAYGSRRRRCFGAIGDEVNTAARLMRLAQPGQVLVSGRLRAALEQAWTLEPQAPMVVKGRSEPMPVFAVAGPRRQRSVRLEEPVQVLPLVGREAEVAQLEQALAEAAAGQGRVLALVAEAGMGKSRLVAEAVRLAQRRGFIGYGGASAGAGVCPAYGPWQALWSAFFDHDPALPLRRRQRMLQAALQRLAPEHAEAWPLLDVVLGEDWPDEPFAQALQSADRKALREAVLLRCLAGAARQAAEDGMGLLLVLEDLHAADPLSLDLLVRIAQGLAGLPVLLLASSRPAEAGGAPALARLAALPQVRTLALGGLAPAATEQLIRATLALRFPGRSGATPRALIDRIAALAQGHPFHVEELVAALQDRGLDPRDPQAAALPLPASLHSLVLSRIDALPAPQQRGLKAASIVGRRFDLDGLHGYCPSLGPREAVAEDLEALHRAGLTPQAGPGQGYLFRHLVTLEASYASLAADARTQLHGLYARFLETRGGGAASTLAHHFVQAGLRGPALRWLRTAGEQAAARHANDEALACFEQALARLGPGDDGPRFELLLQTEAVLDLQGRHDARRRVLAELERLVRSSSALAPETQPAAQVAVRRARLEVELGAHADALASAQAASTVADGPLQVDALLLQARAMFHAGQAEAAGTTLAQALERARALGYRRGEYGALSQLGLRRWNAGAYDEAEARLGEALALAREASDLRAQINILNNLGVVAKARGRPAQAVGHYEQAQALARRIGDRSGEAMLLNNMGSAALAAGDFDAAGSHAAAAAALYAELDEPLQRAMALNNSAEAHRGRGRHGPAQAALDEALALLRAGGQRRGLAIVLESQGLLLQAQGRSDAARRAYDEALAIAQEIGSRALEGSVRLNLGLLHLEDGRPTLALASLEPAVALLQPLGDEAALQRGQAAAARARQCLAPATGPVHE